ncbi:unnamed protein product [Kuraishia capsulata CBS 1993]|uniref:Protein HGH1 homolog n=1 Tax=Kuraishia capsulata CBS 1993 TaxID=1382522 RepID=W6MJN3_9ASCO|nr:uncharacterized protein KUCA_T00002164001 [Kuraishia capsulata CBS 1993]CDK26193.1 unnamed protein product [Kuraishia capsulata CBS 1993]
MPTELEELVSFLHAEHRNVREIALENLVGFSPSGPNQKIFQYDNYRAVKDLEILILDKKVQVVQQALTILANLCDDSHVRELILENEQFVRHLLEQITFTQNKNADLMSILLANLAKTDAITKIFEFTLNVPEKQLYKSAKAMDCMMDCFVKGSERKHNPFADFDYLSYFFADVSRFPLGRMYFVTKQSYDDVVPLSKLLVFTEKYDSKNRREGVASTIKNSLFETEQHEMLLTSEINLLPYILLPITGQTDELDEDDMFNLPDELQLLGEDKKRDPVNEIITVHLESLLLLCVTRFGREYLRKKSVYPLIRELHKAYEDELIAELCDRLVQMLMRDEPPSNEEVKAMHSDAESDDDDDDDKITEIL